jgi:predicted transcriptional regulator
MSKSVSIDARITVDVDERLSKLAVATGRSKSRLIADAVRSYVASEAAFVEAVEEGLRDLDAGDVVDHDTVFAELERRKRSRA